MTTTRETIQVGTRIEAGEGEDYDTGVVLRMIDADTAEIGWDSGVKTDCLLADLTPIS